MCGIAGIWNFDRAPVTDEAITRFTSSLAHRGPDGQGVWRDDSAGLALGHRRLAILDLSDAGHQPMCGSEGRFWITYNGEIYNFLELRTQLEALGNRFTSESDTEVILAAFSTWGASMLERFNGMWALAIWDQVERRLFLARDRFGVKPLLYLAQPNRLAFASEMKAFRALQGFEPRIDLETASVLMHDAFRVEGSQRTLLADVRRLQAGHYAIVSAGGSIEIRRWWNSLDHLPEIPNDPDAQAEQFRNLFFDAVKLRMRSDVPLGTCLSGGFDSTAVLCAMAEIGRAGGSARLADDWQHAFVATFPGASNDERPQAEEAARFAQVQPRIFPIDQSHALADIDRILFDFDDVYIGLPTAPWLIYRELRRNGIRVSLDGHGADELMGGYRTAPQLLLHNAPPLLTSPLDTVRRLKNVAAFHASQAGSPSARQTASQTLRSIWAFHPSLRVIRNARARWRGHIAKDTVAASRSPGAWTDSDFALPWEADQLPSNWGDTNRELYRMVHATTLPTLLRNFDRVSMAHGVEVRMPFLDWRLVTYTLALPDAAKIGDLQTKRVARAALRGHMPESIRTSRIKIGFNSPMPEWLSGPLHPWIRQTLADSKTLPLPPGYRGPTNEQLLSGARMSWQDAARMWLHMNYLWFTRRMNTTTSSMEIE